MSTLRERIANALDPKAAAAIKTLESLGYTYHGGELWKPPLGKTRTPAFAERRDSTVQFPPRGSALADAVSAADALFAKHRDDAS